MGAAKRFTQNPGRNAICYYRYSSDAQRDASIEQQRQEAHKYAESHDMTIIKEYADRAVLGTRDDRVEYNLMLYDAERLKPAYLILCKTDRLSRDRYDSVIAKSRLRSCGVRSYTRRNFPKYRFRRFSYPSALSRSARYSGWMEIPLVRSSFLRSRYCSVI